jgi:hypothetical protein
VASSRQYSAARLRRTHVWPIFVLDGLLLGLRMAYHLLMRQAPASTAPLTRLIDHLDTILLAGVIIPSILLVNLSFYIKCVRMLQGKREGRCRGAGSFPFMVT